MINNTNNCFMALYPGLPVSASTRRNIQPVTPIMIINYPSDQLHPSTTTHSILPL